MTVDALDEYTITGVVRDIAPDAVTNQAGDKYYPVRVDLDRTGAEIRPGMSVRVHFPPKAA